MSNQEFQIDVEPHPILRPAAFTTVFPAPLGEIVSPNWVMDLPALEAEAPLSRDEAVRLRGRDMLRHWGHKPAGRGKPASEYLVRAVGQGDLGSINVAVDILNVVSLHSGFSIALVDLNLARPPFRVAPGPEDGSYVFNASGQEMALKGLICLFDSAGPCGNPVKDALRVKTTAETKETLTVVWGSEGFEERRDKAVCPSGARFVARIRWREIGLRLTADLLTPSRETRSGSENSTERRSPSCRHCCPLSSTAQKILGVWGSQEVTHSQLPQATAIERRDLAAVRGPIWLDRYNPRRESGRKRDFP